MKSSKNHFIFGNSCRKKTSIVSQILKRNPCKIVANPCKYLIKSNAKINPKEFFDFVDS